MVDSKKICKVTGCSEEQGSNGTCKTCSATAVRVTRKLKSYTEEDKELFSNLGSIARAEFNQKARNSFGPDLDLLITHTIKTVAEISVFNGREAVFS